jgi:hypothetical protein
VVIIDTMASVVGLAAMRIWWQGRAERVDLLAHGARITDDAPRPIEHALTLGREALEARAALHEQYAERVFELFDGGGEGRLAHAAGFGSEAEMPLARETQ